MKRREFIAGLGGTVVRPMVARAQEPPPLVGFLYFGGGNGNLPGFRQGLAEAGFVERKNVRFEFYGSTDNSVFPALAAELVNKRPAVIVATGSPAPVLAARAASSTVPIVFTTALDPLKYDFVTSLNRPVGNMTGISLLGSELVGKRLSFLRELIPQAKKLAYLSGPATSPAYGDLLSQTRVAGRALGFEIIVLEIERSLDLDSAFTTAFQQEANGATVGEFTRLAGFRDRIIALAARHKIPTMYPNRSWCAGGGLMSYGADFADANRQLGIQYVARILKGARPSDLPVQQATKFELVINLKTAKALGLTIPETLLATADEVIQ
jgi:putative tryptophan/tyrosine transport system substrate-binding protein